MTLPPSGAPPGALRILPVPRYRLLVLAGIALSAALFLPISVEVNTAFIERMMDSAHVPAFAGLVWLVFRANPLGFVSRRSAIVLAAIVGVIAAGAVELIQARTGRDATFIDFRNGVFGAGLATSFLAFRTTPAILTSLVGTLVCLIIALRPAVHETRAIFWRSANFPILGDFESDDELPLWLTLDRDRLASWPPRGRVPDHATHGQSSLRVPIHPGTWPGVRVLCADRDWSTYRTLAFDIYNEGAPFDLAVRIDDSRSTNHQDRYNAAFPIAPGKNRLHIPLTSIAQQPRAGQLDLKAIRRLVFFVDHPTKEFVFYLDHVRLE